MGDEFGGTVLRHFFESIAAFAVTVEEEKERSFLGWFLARGLLQEVLELMVTDSAIHLLR